jgi:hypothetical protein
MDIGFVAASLLLTAELVREHPNIKDALFG